MTEVVVTLSSALLTAPGISESKVLFDSTVAFPGKRMAQGAGLKRIKIDVTHDQDASIRLDKSDDRGATWVTAQPAVTAAAASQPANEALDVSGYDDFRVVWVNGGTAQTVWEPSVSLSEERSGI